MYKRQEFAHRYANDYDVVACAGGDGTYNEMIDGVISSGAKCKVGYIPAGSTNDFGSSIGLSKNIIEAAKAIANDESITLDVGSFNGRYFSYVASFGAVSYTHLDVYKRQVLELHTTISTADSFHIYLTRDQLH